MGRTGSGQDRKLARPTIISDRLGRPQCRVRVPLLVLGLPGVVHLEAAVELLPARRQQLDVCGTERKSEGQTGSHEVSETDKISARQTDRRTDRKSTGPVGRLAVPELTT